MSQNVNLLDTEAPSEFKLRAPHGPLILHVTGLITLLFPSILFNSLTFLYNCTSLPPCVLTPLHLNFFRWPPERRLLSPWTAWIFVHWGMTSDISADVAYLGGVWAEGVLYGTNRFPSSSLSLISWYDFQGIQWVRSPTNIACRSTDRCTLTTIAASSIIIFFTLCYIFTSSAYTRGREKSSQ